MSLEHFADAGADRWGRLLECAGGVALRPPQG